jgi:hypothetical protein
VVAPLLAEPLIDLLARSCTRAFASTMLVVATYVRRETRRGVDGEALESGQRAAKRDIALHFFLKEER